MRPRKTAENIAGGVRRQWVRESNVTYDYEEYDMHKLRFALATLAVVGVIGGALADDSGHASINSLKWQTRRHQSGVYASSWRSCAVEQIGAMNGCRYHRRQYQ